MNRAKRTAIFTRLRAENPEPTTALDFGTPFELLIAVMFSAQATDVEVNWAKLFPAARTPATMLNLGLDRLKDFIRSIGLFNTKAENILKTCRILLDQHGSEVPRGREALETLPGDGCKTANVVLNTAFGEPTIAVDTHILRVCNRPGIAPGKTPARWRTGCFGRRRTTSGATRTNWLILRGRYVCTARRPRCGECAIEDVCEFEEKGGTPPGEVAT